MKLRKSNYEKNLNKMKTIRELKAEIDRHHKDVKDFKTLNSDMNKLGEISHYFREALYKEHQISILKDVLKLIDELMLKYGSTALDELKSKIEG